MKHKIICVEDNPINALILEKMLKKHYEHVMVVNSASDCLHALASQECTVVITDIDLGEGHRDGTTLLQDIRQISSYDRIKVVALTAFAMPEERKKFLDMGFDAYTTKPIVEQDLVRIIEKFS